MAKKRKTPGLPSCETLTRLIKSLKKGIHEDYRAPGCEDDTIPSMQITVGWSPETGDWDYQTGDNSYSGGAYLHPVWGVAEITRRCRSVDVARDIRAQLSDQWEG